MFDDLLAQPGVEEVSHLRSRFGLMALHGGNLERGTDVIAADAAERAGASLYVVRQPPGLRWHVPSVAFDPAASPALAAFLDHVDVAVAVHGYGRPDMWTTLLVGGRNRPLAAALRAALEGGLGQDFRVEDDDTPEALETLFKESVAKGQALIDEAVAAGGLGFTASVQDDDGNHANLRRIPYDLIEEYGRHVGHADLIRESVDGLVGEDPA